MQTKWKFSKSYPRLLTITIAVALEAASKLHRSSTYSCKKDNVTMLCDCKSAITMAIQRPHLTDCHGVIQRLRASLHALKSQEVAVSVRWIPSHSGIEYNELADLAAQTAFEKATVVSQGSVSLPACKWLVTKQVNRRWQQRWNQSVTGRVTYSFIPQVGRNSFLLRD